MNRNLWYILSIGFLLVLVCAALMQPATAYPRVPQGGVVYLNETYDISGVAAGYQYLAYQGKYSSDWSASNWTITYMIDLPATKEGYYNYTINPDPFELRPGYWYRYNGIYEKNANNRAFRVVKERPPVNYTYNETEIQYDFFPPEPPVVPERKVADYLLARGDPFNVTYNFSRASVWIFGRVNGIYDRKVVNGTAKFNATETAGLEPGRYDLLYYSPGEDRQFNMRITKDTLEYFDSEEFKVRTVDIRPLTPPLILDRIQWMAKVNDDNFTLYHLEVQEPAIDITSIDSIMVDEKNQTGVLQVRGYTNLANNSVLSFILDSNKVPERLLGESRMQNTWNSTVLAVEDPGSMRYFDYSIPIRFWYMNPGQHTITVKGEHNAKMETSFYIYDLPEGSLPRNQTIRYVGGYEFVPTPTPEIVIQTEVVREVVTQVISVDVTPSNEQVRAEQDSIIRGYVVLGIVIGVLLVVVIFGAKYLYGAWKRSKIE